MSTVTPSSDQFNSENDHPSRRDFLRRSALLSLAVGTLSCDFGGSDSDDDDGGGGVAQTFDVTVQEIDSSYPYSDQNQLGVAYAIDGEVGETITLERGETYEFELGASVESGPGGFPHPFYVDRTPEGQGANPYNQGVDNAESVTGTVTFTVPESAPDTLYYECMNHVYMGGEMTIEG